MLLYQCICFWCPLSVKICKCMTTSQASLVTKPKKLYSALLAVWDIQNIDPILFCDGLLSKALSKFNPTHTMLCVKLYGKPAKISLL